MEVIFCGLIVGPTLREWIDHRLSIKQPLSSYEALVVIHQVLGILGRLKQASVLHDDIKGIYLNALNNIICARAHT
jgi:serine/threonine protein kinase